MPPPSRTLGEVIRESRLGKDITLRELARKLELAPSYISDVEMDRRVPSEEVLKKIAKVLGLNLDELLARAGRVSEEAERFLKRNPEAGVVFRRLPDLSQEQLRKLIEQLDRPKKERGGR